ncbi:hypothetical protein GGR58DRAFT_527559 [Xylaria digitata]|nr:hypothetical protein GGR58DRAFT_527559 [Xylaria digitata]
MDLTNMLNTASAAPSTGGTADYFNSAPVTPGYEDEGRLLCPIAASPSEISTLQPVTEARPSGHGKKSWDEGGFTLSPGCNSSLASAPRSIGAISRPTSQKSSKHKISNSYSSVSSYASPPTSEPHSRISSISTTGEMQSMGLTPEASPSELGQDHIQGDCFKGERPFALGFDPRRSPSDAVLISKSSRPPNGDNDGGEMSTHGTTRRIIRFSLGPNRLGHKAHKRTVSAPNPQGANSLRQSYSIPHPHGLQSTTPQTQFNQQVPSGIVGSLNPSPSATSNSSVQNPPIQNPPVQNPPVQNPWVPNNRTFRCLWEDNCNTGSSLRKAVSHYFGRNKVVTRLCPDSIWVHLCRKHYQRGRYRNGPFFAKLSCELVLEQIQNIHDWNERNRRNGLTRVTLDWSLRLRKREEDRIRAEATAKKRRHSQIGDEGDDNNSSDNLSDGPSLLNPISNPVPDWLKEKCGSGFDTAYILQVARRIHQEVAAGTLPQIPDIEILPNLPTGRDEGAKLKVSKFKSHRGMPHKRSRSLGITRPSQPHILSMQRPNPVSNFPYMGSAGLSSFHNRQQTIDLGQFYDPQPPLVTAQDSSVVHHLPYRPAFPQEPLTHENNTDASMITQLERNVPGPSRFVHQRSVSEHADRQSIMRSGHRMSGPPPSGHLAPTYPEPPAFPHTGPPLANPYHTPPDQSLPIPPDALYSPPRPYFQQTLDGSRHSRHQSTPNAIPSTLPQPQAHSYSNGNASYQAYRTPSDLSNTSSAPNTSLHRTPGRPVMYAAQPGMPEPEQTHASYNNANYYMYSGLSK